ncbi:septum site-determining protein MinC [Oikeobacillus pervagus]|uniref:Probable septum site-determining protein MinC n=1 Tax=Oikeobacillus pervagus TaxID=1325931 RepID=A0AAJ1SZK0_9BACI|nr:septum site-determining protein MinC [Oikeobacillus pervagus]MDQ0214557.1 septum site-determining protein MinC [Oikeobacillus pervagus]
MKKRQNVIIKGTKDGLTLHLNDKCSYDELLEELEQKMDGQQEENETPLITVKIQAGNRYLTAKQKEEMKEIIRKKKHFVVKEVSTNVVTIEEATRWKEESDMTKVAGMIRSGQVLEVPGDILIIGDVNPGGTVKAGGNIFILGSLKGIVHAGVQGNEKAVVVASRMTPSQLRISEYSTIAPHHNEEKESHEMECAYIDEKKQIIVDRLQTLRQIRPNITSFKGGSYSG